MMNEPTATNSTPIHEGLAKPLCVRADRAADMLGIGKTKLYELIGAGELELIRIGRRSVILRSSLEAFVERQRCR